MSHLRTFTDASGTTWDVWPIYPHVSGTHPQYESPGIARVRLSDAPPSPPDGWLCFQSTKGARRRLMPIPGHWAAAPDEELGRLCEAAIALPPRQDP